MNETSYHHERIQFGALLTTHTLANTRNLFQNITQDSQKLSRKSVI